MNVPFVDLSWQEREIRADRERRFAETIARNAFVLGPDVEEFEHRFAKYCEVAHCVGVGNGTDALMLMYDALGIGEGDEVITIPTTFIASVSPLVHSGAKPVFVDIDPATRTFDLKKLEAAITPKTKAILVVHLFGDMPDMDALKKIADKKKILFLEDACQAHGALYKGKRAGSFGKAAAFSFYPGKNLGAYGDGGAITTNDAALAETLRMLRNQGGIKKYEHAVVGFNSRLDTLQAVVLDEKLKRLDPWNDMRRAIAARYRTGLKNVPQLRLPPENPDVSPVFHLFVVEVLEGDRDTFMQALKEKGIATGIHYPEPLHLTPALSSLGYTKGDFPAAEDFAKRIVSLPIYPGMSDEQTTHVVRSIRDHFHA
ncbi:MAG TPA: DegT/DnrJ/EryC1/StrS family aminotransferase [Candidatus Paceibacterota bacterium]|nr:DegT/DnrJ/EryC1/StrS family aminotransferase [Candidatus Paceibacterota bacterium]